MGNIRVNFTLVCILLASAFRISEACNGYQLKITRAENCNPNNIIRLDNFNITLDEDCNVIPSGCIVFTKSFESAQTHYTVSKPPLPALEGNLDICESLKGNRDELAKMAIKMFSLPNKCPMPATKICGNPDKKINISKYKTRLSLIAGNINVKVNMIHENGMSCFEGSATVEKVRQG